MRKIFKNQFAFTMIILMLAASLPVFAADAATAGMVKKFDITSDNFSSVNMTSLTSPENLYDGITTSDSFAEGSIYNGDGGIVVDLGGDAVISNIKLYPGDEYYAEYMAGLEIRATNDSSVPYAQWNLLGQTWSDDNTSSDVWSLANVTTNEETGEISSLTGDTYRYVFLGRTGENQGQFGLCEFEIYIEKAPYVGEGKFTYTAAVEEIKNHKVVQEDTVNAGWGIFPASNLFDGNAKTMAYHFRDKKPIVIDLGEAKRIKEVKATARGDGAADQSALIDIKFSNTIPTSYSEFDNLKDCATVTTPDWSANDNYAECTLPVDVCGQKYRYVSIHRSWGNYMVHSMWDVALAELEIYSESDREKFENHTVAQQETLAAYPASNLFDGNAKTMSYHFRGNKPIVIDLGEAKTITEIVVTARGDDCANDSALTDIKFSNTIPASWSEFDELTDCVTVITPNWSKTDNFAKCTLPVNANGQKYRYISIHRTYAHVLEIENNWNICVAGLEVYGEAKELMPVYNVEYEQPVNRDAQLVTAVYEGTKLVDINVKNITLKADEKVFTSPITYSDSGDNATVKVFLWDGVKPYNNVTVK